MKATLIIVSAVLAGGILLWRLAKRGLGPSRPAYPIDKQIAKLARRAAKGSPEEFEQVARAPAGDVLADHIHWSLRVFLEMHPDTVRSWADDEPTNWLAWTALGVSCHGQAFRARGTDVASNVSSEQFGGFSYYVNQCLDALDRAENCSPNNACIIIQRIIPSCFASDSAELGLAEMRRALAVEPHSFYARQQMFRMLRPRWYGVGTLAAVEFAMAQAAVAPRGSNLHLLLFQAAQDLYEHLLHFEDAPHAAKRVWHDLKEPLRAAWRAFSQRERTIHHSEVFSVNHAATAFYLAGDTEYLRGALEVIGDRFVPLGWADVHFLAVWRFRKARFVANHKNA